MKYLMKSISQEKIKNNVLHQQAPSSHANALQESQEAAVAVKSAVDANVQLVDAMKNAINNNIDAGKETGEALMAVTELAYDKSVDAVNAKIDAGQNYLSNLWTDSINGAKNIANASMNKIGELKDGALADLREAKKDVKDFAVDNYNDAKDYAVDNYNDAKDLAIGAKEYAANAKAALGESFSNMQERGRQIRTGISTETETETVHAEESESSLPENLQNIGNNGAEMEANIPWSVRRDFVRSNNLIPNYKGTKDQNQQLFQYLADQK